jgi:hypothetical protein
VARADDSLVDSSGVADDGSLIYERSAYDFKLVIEGRPGGTLADVGSSTFNWDPTNPTTLPDLQVEASKDLGTGPGIGSPAVCDDTGPTPGGVPAVNPFDFSPAAAPAINDFACRFKDGSNARQGITDSSFACTKIPPSDTPQFVRGSGSKIQFCSLVDQPISFPVGDTVVAARIRDIAGNVSQVHTLVIRVLAPTPMP